MKTVAIIPACSGAIRFFSAWAAVLAFLLSVGRPGLAQEEGSFIILKDGRTLSGAPVEIGSTQITWKLTGLPQPQAFAYSGIERIEFAPPPQWRQAMEKFEKGAFAEAAEDLEAVAVQRNKTMFYPAPGNYSSLADRRLLDCYRRLRIPEEIARVSKRIEWDKLPRTEQNVAKIVDCWAAVGEKDWEKAKSTFETARAEIADTDPAAAELGYLEGLIALESGNSGEVVLALGRAYGADAAADEAMAAGAIKLAIEQLLPDSERRAELRALVQLYSQLHGNGQLWEGAGEALNKMNSEGLPSNAKSEDAEKE